MCMLQATRASKEAGDLAEGHRYPLRDRHAIQRQPFNVSQEAHRCQARECRIVMCDVFCW